MLWAVLLVTRWDREVALQSFRRLAELRRRFPEVSEREDITHSRLEAWPSDRRAAAIELIVPNEHARTALRPLLLFGELPSRALWEHALGTPADEDDWHHLAQAVVRVLDHQSEDSTDCRWARLIFQIVGTRSVRFVDGPEVEDTVRGYLEYPHYGDLRKVRPSIRAAEIGIDMARDTVDPWPDQFWSECLRRTGCFRIEPPTPVQTPRIGTTLEVLAAAEHRVAEHADSTRTTTAIDARHEALFGGALFALAVVRELLGLGVSGAILGRTALRTLAELVIVMSYLLQEDRPELWQTYRVHGSGQAKLALLHTEASGVTPGYVDIETLEGLANEDMWEEHLASISGTGSSRICASRASGQAPKTCMIATMLGHPCTGTDSGGLCAMPCIRSASTHCIVCIGSRDLGRGP